MPNYRKQVGRVKMNRYLTKSLLFILVFNFHFLAFADESDNFIHLKAEIDRQQTIATSVIEDSLGYLWINSNSGILRYDGYDYRPYSNHEIFGKEASSAAILDISKDYSDNIWFVSTKGAISKLMPSGKFFPQYSPIAMLAKNQSLESFHIDSSRLWLGSNFGTLIGQSLIDSTTIRFDIYSSGESITSIAKGKKDIIWFSTNKGKIFQGNTSTMESKELQVPFHQSSNRTVLTTDANGNLWIGTELNGLYFYDIASKTYEQFHKKAATSHFVPTNMIIRIFRDSKGLIWAGTDGGGLCQVDPKTKKIKIYKHSKTNKFSLQSNSVIGFGETKNKDIWIFTNYGNINILPHESSRVKYHSGSISGSPTRVLSILKCKNENLWIGTDGEGISIIDKSGKTIQQHIAKTKSANGLTGNYIQAIAEDQNQNKWIGTYLNGLVHYNIASGKFSSIPIKGENRQTGTDIRSLYIDSKNRLWVGSNIGVSVLSLAGKQLAFFPYNTDGLNGNIAEIFMEDEFGNLWIGLYLGGISLLHENKNIFNSKFTSYKLTASTDKSENSVLHGVPDYAGNLYLVNSYGKLLKFNLAAKKTMPIKGFDKEDLHKFTAVLLSDSSNLWVSKNNGISHLDFKNSQEYDYTWKNGTLKNRFLSGSASKGQDGTLYFGGVGGLNYFKPSQMKTQQKKLNLYINQIKIVNRDAEEIIPQKLSKGIEHLKKLELNYKQTSFSFHFSVINDHLDPNYFYAYRLKGFDKEWISSENARTATYTNIPYGAYTFEVKAGTKRNRWDIAARKIQIKVLAPLWRRWWFYAIYAIVFFFIALFIIRYYIAWDRLKKQLIREELQNEKNKELYAMKMNFFAKMSHEIQTPLTLILSPLENMMERAEGNLLLRQRLQVIKNNAKRLSRIALELMTIRNKEIGKLKIKASSNNICKDIQKIALSFSEQARFKSIDFSIEGTDKVDTILWYDKEKLEHILYNLLANSFKFTSREGKITIHIQEDEIENKVFIKVIDTGIGIPESDLKNIFELFYQSEDGKLVDGTGIGLALTKELISLHKGSIEVVSTSNKGTTFTIGLRKGKNHFTAEEIKHEQLYEISERSTLDSVTSCKEEINSVFDENKKNILLVEDNFEMLLFLEANFTNN